jgi:hypothetical protein
VALALGYDMRPRFEDPGVGDLWAVRAMRFLMPIIGWAIAG